MFTPIKTVYLSHSLSYNQAISKKIHQFVKDILHRTVNRTHPLEFGKIFKSCKSEISLCSLSIHTFF